MGVRLSVPSRTGGARLIDPLDVSELPDYVTRLFSRILVPRFTNVSVLRTPGNPPTLLCRNILMSSEDSNAAQAQTSKEPVVILTHSTASKLAS